MGGLQAGIALNPASAWAGYEPPDLRPTSRVRRPTRPRRCLTRSWAWLPPRKLFTIGDLNDPVAQHTFGIGWLTQQIVAGNDAPLLPGSQGGASNLPAGNDPPVPSMPVLDPVTTEAVPQINPHDPNNVIGPQGCGTNQYVSNNQPLTYQVNFQNQPSANAPAQQVTVTQPLDPNLNWGSFRLGSFGFSGQVYQVPANTAYYQTTIDLTQTEDFDVNVTATVDESTGIATWVFTTIDPATGLPPTDPNIGFLPPDNSSGVGEAFVSYTVTPAAMPPRARWSPPRPRSSSTRSRR